MTQDAIEDLLPVQCQICREHIANVRMVRLPGGVLSFPDLKYPLTGAMFLSPDPGHGIIPPFHASHTWDMFHCPHGGHRPILTPTKIQTPVGALNVRPGGEPFLGGDMAESDRDLIMDRAIDAPVGLTEDEAAAEYRRRMVAEGGQVVGETDTEAEAAGNEEDGEDGGPDGEREAGATGSKEAATSSLVCDRCQRSFKSRSGLMRHRKQVHGLRTAWGR
jgi:hypothetical protein